MKQKISALNFDELEFFLFKQFHLIFKVQYKNNFGSIVQNLFLKIQNMKIKSVHFEDEYD
jgi:hypothetical protein